MCIFTLKSKIYKIYKKNSSMGLRDSNERPKIRRLRRIAPIFFSSCYILDKPYMHNIQKYYFCDIIPDSIIKGILHPEIYFLISIFSII